MTSDISIRVALTLTGKGVLPDAITQHLGFLPTETWRLGELIGKTKLVREHDGWVHEIDKQDTFDLEQVVLLLLDAVEPYRDQILSAAGRFGLDTEVSCSVYTTATMPSINFTADTLARLNLLRCTIDIDIIVAG